MERNLSNVDYDPDIETLKANVYDKSLLDLRQAFALFDKDGNGEISKDELGHCLQSIGIYPTPAELDFLYQRMDKDGNGHITFDEFLVAMSDECEEQELEQELHDMQCFFSLMDKDGSGRLSPDELQRAIKSMGVEVDLETCQYLHDQMIRGGGSSEDGVSFEDFASFLLKYDCA